MGRISLEGSPRRQPEPGPLQDLGNISRLARRRCMDAGGCRAYRAAHREEPPDSRSAGRLPPWNLSAVEEPRRPHSGQTHRATDRRRRPHRAKCTRREPP